MKDSKGRKEREITGKPKKYRVQNIILLFCLSDLICWLITMFYKKIKDPSTFHGRLHSHFMNVKYVKSNGINPLEKR